MRIYTSAHPGERRDPDRKTPTSGRRRPFISLRAFAGMSGYRLAKLGGLILLAPVALTTACATDGVYGGGDAGPAHFNQIGRAPPPTAASKVAAVQDALPGLSVDEARRRVEAYLAQAGFQPEGAVRAGLYVISGDRMTSATGQDAAKPDALCELRALERPQMYTTHVDVRLEPASPAAEPAGVRLGIEVKVVELDANLLSGAFSKQTCHSRGALEAALRRAAVGG